ncbi:Cytochrome c oxidase assembly factor like [Quillaja saponaria]|uniref:Cytochrome c oxidase assembly factor like n=1 Tax=Quillaja saponaria TaxID=32244 RepID=A0AAD7QF28_QUISA|nr:Cytochrome c oxidase assembly factor like [Quillaja saponaria]
MDQRPPQRPKITSLPSPQPPQQHLHQTDADDDDENVKQLNECSSVYLSLQNCLVETNRNWKSCQKKVQALKECNERRKNDKGK